MILEELEEALAELIPGAVIEEDDDGQLVVYTGLRHSENGELESIDPDEEDPDLDPDFEPLQEDDDE
jgi:hypothetical protein